MFIKNNKIFCYYIEQMETYETVENWPQLIFTSLSNWDIDAIKKITKEELSFVTQYKHIELTSPFRHKH